MGGEGRRIDEDLGQAPDHRVVLRLRDVEAQAARLGPAGGDVIGQQYQTATGPIDILAVKKDGTELLVVELKRGAATDRTVGQVQRYMGYIKQEVAEPGQKVRGLIIALEDDVKLQYALAVAPDISFYTYRVSFNLNHTGGLTL